MIRFNKTTLFLLVAALGVWGCGRSTPPETRGASQVRALEAKIAKLEEEVQTSQAARDHLRLKLEALEKDRGAIDKRFQVLAHERNDLRAQLMSRTSERDTLQTQYESFRAEIRNVLGHADAAAPGSVRPVTAANLATSPGKS
jgi:septal ring factor EnvC (AmiA/AmiB activator)